MGTLNKVRKEIYRNVWNSGHCNAWTHHFVFKENVRTKKKAGCSYGNLRIFLIPLAYYGQSKRLWRETKKCGVWQGNVQSDISWCQENCALRCPGNECLIFPHFLNALRGFQFLESIRQCSISSFSPGTFIKFKTMEPKSAGGAHKLFPLIRRS